MALELSRRHVNGSWRYTVEAETGGGGGGDDGGGIQFDTSPQAGDWLYMETHDSAGAPGGYGIDLKTTEGGIQLYADSVLNTNSHEGTFITDDGPTGIRLVATGEGSGFGAGELRLDCLGGTTTLRNTDEGVVLYSTGEFSPGRITDLSTAAPDFDGRPGMIIAAPAGLVVSAAGIDPGEEHGSLNIVFLYTDTGSNLLCSPAVLARTTDPGIPGALYNSSGTVKVSL